MESVDADVCLADRFSLLDHPSFILAAVIRMLAVNTQKWVKDRGDQKYEARSRFRGN